MTGKCVGGRPVLLFLLGTALGAALVSTPAPVAGATVEDLDPSPTRVVVRDPVMDIWNGNRNQGLGAKTERTAATINLTRLTVTYTTSALILRSHFINLSRHRSVGLYFRIGTPRHPFIDYWDAAARSPSNSVSIGEALESSCRGTAKWAYREDFVTMRVPWNCVPGADPTRTPRRVIVHGESGRGALSDYVPSRDSHSFTPPVVRPRA